MAGSVIDAGAVQTILDWAVETHADKVAGGVQVALLAGGADGTISSHAAGFQDAYGTPLSADGSWLELCSLSKTIASAFSISFLERRHGIDLSARVNDLLRRYKSPFRLLDDAAGGFSLRGAADSISVRHLMNHTGLGMHYVYGTPLSEPVPSTLEVMEKGNCSVVTKHPAKQFKYSGGGFLLLQHLVELISGQPVAELLQEFLTANTRGDVTFDQHQKTAPPKGRTIATGFDDARKAVPDGGRMMFPPFAAGALGSARGLAYFLTNLSLAYHDETAGTRTSGPVGNTDDARYGGISHATARAMLDDTMDCGARGFMNSDAGLGVFVMRAGNGGDGGDSRYMLHQAANEGFRGLYFVCFDGAEYHRRGGPSGFVALANGDNGAVPMLGDVAVSLLRDVLAYGGFDWRREGATVDISTVAQEQIVNELLNERVFKSAIDPLAAQMVAGSSPQVVQAPPLTASAFAEFGEVVTAPEPTGIPGHQYETAIVNDGTGLKYGWLADQVNLRKQATNTRANMAVFACQPRPVDDEGNFTHGEMERHLYSSQLFYPLDRTTPCTYVLLVAHGTGGYPDMRTLRAFVGHEKQGFCYRPGVWHAPLCVFGDKRVDFMSVTYCDGSAEDCHLVNVPRPFRVKVPDIKCHGTDGAVTRVAPMTPAGFDEPKADAGKPAWQEMVDWASSALGGRVMFATDDWFSECEKLISPAAPIFIDNRFTDWGKWMDGWETRRKRQGGHDWAILRLARPVQIFGFEIDTAFFTGNQAPALSIQAARVPDEAASDPAWAELRELRDDAHQKSPGGGYAQGEDPRAQKAADRLNSAEWKEIMSRTRLGAGYEDRRHHAVAVSEALSLAAGGGWTHLRVNLYPDGGVARLRVRGKPAGGSDTASAVVPAAAKEGAAAASAGENTSAPCQASDVACLYDLAAAVNGGVALGASNAHYGRASNLIAPGRAAQMDEGWETARNPNRPPVLELNADGHLVIPDLHVDWVVLRLSSPGHVTHVEVDTNHFKGNCPESCLVEAACAADDVQFNLDAELRAVLDSNTGWKAVLSRTRLTPHARHFFTAASTGSDPVTHVRIKIFPDGGVSRLRVFGMPALVSRILPHRASRL